DTEYRAWHRFRLEGRGMFFRRRTLGTTPTSVPAAALSRAHHSGCLTKRARWPAGPAAERPVEAGNLREAEQVRHLRDGVVGALEVPGRQLAPRLVEQLFEARPRPPRRRWSVRGLSASRRATSTCVGPARRQLLEDPPAHLREDVIAVQALEILERNALVCERDVGVRGR